MSERGPSKSGPSRRYDPDPVKVTKQSQWPYIKVGLALLAVAALAVYGTVGGELQTGSEFDASAAEDVALKELNEAREANGLPALPREGELTSFARDWSATMGDRGALEHSETACGRNGGENIGYVDVAGRSPEAVGEDLATGWLNSEGHRENIMRSQWGATGVGIVVVDGRAYATQQFC